MSVDPITLRVGRLALIAGAIALWFGTQRWLARRRAPRVRIGDAVHRWTAPINRWLHAHRPWADGLLAVTSLIVDGLGLFVLATAIFGPSLRPFAGLVVLFALRQVCQMLCALPRPEGAIWRDPGVPSLLVTYHTDNDLFFSGHTALSVYAATELASLGEPWLAAAGVAIAAFQAVSVLVLRAHYTMDVVAGILSGLWAAGVAAAVGPACDRWLAALLRS